MGQVFEALMIIFFGMSWPVNLYKSFKMKSTKGKSLLFLLFILFGYAFGIAGKIITNKITWVFAFYVLNFTMVFLDVIMYFVNKNKEK